MAGFFLGYVFRPTPKNQIQYCRERDGRGEEYDIEKEDAISLETKTEPPLRFFKYGRGYVFTIASRLRKLKKVTRFFGKEGTAYTWRLEGFKKDPTKFKTKTVTVEVGDPPKKKKVKVKEPIEWEPKKVSLEFPTLATAVEHKWGKEFFETVPEDRKKQLMDDKMFVTVNLEPGITPEGYKPITESQIQAKADENMAELLAYKFKQLAKKAVIDWIFPALAGAGALAIASKLMGWW